MQCISFFFDPKVKVGTLGNDLLSPMLRLCESLCQNNECPVESIISIFQSQAFRGQHEETAENRAFIKCNGDTISGGQEFCGILPNMSVNGIPEWGLINRLYRFDMVDMKTELRSRLQGFRVLKGASLNIFTSVKERVSHIE